jgi:hypothetical protein
VTETILTAVVLVFFGNRLVGAARYALSQQGRLHVKDIVRGVRFRHIWPVPFVFALIAALAVLLLQVPGLSWGWWTAIGGQGNPVTGLSDATTGTALEWLVPIVFLTLLTPALPLFAYREEEIFRLNAETWTVGHRIRRSIEFGLVHAIIGIPIGVAIALSIGGGYFTIVYLRAFRRSHDSGVALVESARAHTMYNAMILALAFVVVVVSALASTIAF